MSANPDPNGGGNPNPTPPVDPSQTPPIVEPTPPVNPTPSEVDRYKKDMLKYKEESAQLRQQLEEIKVKTHKEKDDWKSVSEHHEAKAKDYETKYTGLQLALVNEKKIAALSTEAVKQGINPASLPDLELLDFDEISVETTSNGKVLISGQDRAIAKLKTLRPHWFTSPSPGINPTSPGVRQTPSGSVSMVELNAAEEQWKKTKSDSDKKAYYDLIQKYKSQRI
jgi:hypothetical protein